MQAFSPTLKVTLSALLFSLLAFACVVPSNPASPPPPSAPVWGSIVWTPSPAESGTVALSPAGGTYLLGTLVHVTAQANEGFFFDHWQGGSTETTPQIDWVADGDRTFTAVFGNSPRLTFGVFPAESGELVSSAEGPFFDKGNLVTLTQTPAEGFVFDHWEIDGQVVEGTTLSTLEVTMNASHGVKAFFTENEWTLLLYIAGGNELAPQALAALRQLEKVDLRQSKITVLALVDRVATYDSGWSGTRLYRVQYDTTGEGIASSVQLDSVDLGLVAGQSSNLDMGDPETVKKFIRTAKSRYSAAHYGIVFWGHGTGWRSAISRSGERAVGVDLDSGNSMLYTTEIGMGLSAIAEGSPTQKFGLIGMDLCYGSMIETLVELAPYGQYFVGSEGLVPTNGWRYDLALPAFRDLGDRNALAGATTFFDAFKTTYQSLAGSMISVVDLEKVGTLVETWNEWASESAAELTTAALRLKAKKALFLKTTGFYTTPGDLNLDLGDATNQMAVEFPAVDTGEFAAALTDAVKLNFSNVVDPDSGDPLPTHGIAVHFVPLDSDGAPSLPFDDAYVQGMIDPYTPKFVTTSTWVPSTAGNNFLDVIWFKAY